MKRYNLSGRDKGSRFEARARAWAIYRDHRLRHPSDTSTMNHLDQPASSLYATYAESGYGSYSIPLGSPEGSRQYELNHRRWLPRDRESVILDVGCGAGHFLHWLKDEGYRGAEGIDISRAAVQHCAGHGLRADTVTDLLSYLEGAPKRFDCIVMNDVIEHLDLRQLPAILTAARSALRPRGHILVKTVNAATLGGLHLRHSDFTHTVGFNERSLPQLLSATGFGGVTAYPYDSRGAGPRAILLLTLQRMWAIMLRGLLTIELGSDRPRIYTKLMLVVGEA